MKTLVKIALVALVPVSLTACHWFSDQHPHTITEDTKTEIDTTAQLKTDSSALSKTDSSLAEPSK